MSEHILLFLNNMFNKGTVIPEVSAKVFHKILTKFYKTFLFLETENTFF